MPLILSSTAIAEKNKIAATSVFLIALKIDIPGVDESVRVVANNEDVTWQGETWQAFPFEIEEITETESGEVPRVDIRVSNVSREMELYIHEYDLYCKTNGFHPIECTLYVLNTLDLDNNDPVTWHIFKLIQPKTNPVWVTFTLGAANPFNRRSPQRRLVPSCQWKFKSAECGYAGAATTCDKTLDRCRELGNSNRFGGYYAANRVE